MNGRYLLAVSRIRQELTDVERVVARARRAVDAARRHPEDQDLYLDSAALNLHDFYGGLERIFHHIAATVDASAPLGREWHRELLQQMGLAVPRMRPPVLSPGTIKALDEYRSFRHIVRNIYAFEFDPERVEHLVVGLATVFGQVRHELDAFAHVLEQAAEGESI